MEARGHIRHSSFLFVIFIVLSNPYVDNGIVHARPPIGEYKAEEIKNEYPITAHTGRKLSVTCYAEDGGKGKSDIFIVDSNGWKIITKNNSSNLNPSWSPDGSMVAYVSNIDGDYEIYIIEIENSNITKLTNNDAWDSNPSWSPDGKLIAFQSDRVDTQGKKDNDIYIMKSDGSSQKDITNNSIDDQYPMWSPDGKHIVYKSAGVINDFDSDICIMNTDGSNMERIVANGAVNVTPSWSPDGKTIAFASNMKRKITSLAILDIFVVDIEEQKPKVIFQCKEKVSSPEHSTALSPTWSGDGKWIAFHKNYGSEREFVKGGYVTEVYFINIRSKNVCKLTGSRMDAFFPDFWP